MLVPCNQRVNLRVFAYLWKQHGYWRVDTEQVKLVTLTKIILPNVTLPLVIVEWCLKIISVNSGVLINFWNSEGTWSGCMQIGKCIYRICQVHVMKTV